MTAWTGRGGGDPCHGRTNLGLLLKISDQRQVEICDWNNDNGSAMVDASKVSDRIISAVTKGLVKGSLGCRTASSDSWSGSYVACCYGSVSYLSCVKSEL